MSARSVPAAQSRQRERYGIISGAAGIGVNATIFLVELIVGLSVHSIPVTADAFHNLTDVISGVIMILSFLLANKPADNEHPFGHGRIEYLSTLLISLIIILIGFEFLKSSFGKIMHPQPVHFTVLALVLILSAIPLKIFLSLFNRRLAVRINSSALKATSFDALSDVFILAVASVSLVAAAFTTAPVDGWLGILVAVFIMYSGLSIAKKALNPLLGEPPDPQMVKTIVGDLMQFRYITGVHDLIVHNYGPGQFMASVHAEVPADVPVMLLHESIDAAEKELSQKYGIVLVIHMDPLNKDDEEVQKARAALLDAIRPLEGIQSIHDFRIVGKGEKKNLIFDVVIDSDRIRTRKQEENLRTAIRNALQQAHPNYNAVVSFDRNYTCD